MVFSWILLLVFSAFVYLAVVVFILPGAFFKAGCFVESSPDRAVRVFREKNGKSVLFEPFKDYKKFVLEYILSQRDDKKVLVARPQKGVFYLDFDVLVFGARDKVSKVINVKESMLGKTLTFSLDLPPETCYVALIVNSANGTSVPRCFDSKLPRRIAVGFVLANVLLMLAMMFVARLSLANIFGDVFCMDFLRSIPNILTSLAVGLVIALAWSLAVLKIIVKKQLTCVHKAEGYEHV